jgi:hypothetical protein
MEDFDTTPVNENESECPCCAALTESVYTLSLRVAALEAMVADLGVSRAVMRQALEDQDEEWY